MRVMTVLGTRPEIIRLSRIIRLLDQYCDHVLVHTGQNYAPRLKDIFFKELGIRSPDITLEADPGSFGAQVGRLFEWIEDVFAAQRPDRLLILGDTNSGLVSIVARRMGIPVYHMEAGNRCYDDRVPEEVNRRIIDHSSTLLLPYTQNSKQNLLAEGIPGHRIFVTGNPIAECIHAVRADVASSRILESIGVRPKEYFLVTLHRAENVDDAGRLRAIVRALEATQRVFGLPMLCSTHPRTRDRLAKAAIGEAPGVRFLEPWGFIDFLRLEESACCVLSDSGTVQEECAILGVPNVTLRDVTERPETLECGSNALAGAEQERLEQLIRFVTAERSDWEPPAEYMKMNVSETVVRILLSYRIPDHGESAWANGVQR
jgi:UDP-N-acetylglucosamine 2-epimerase (non-hydrolysing)